MKKFLNVIYILLAIFIIGTAALAVMPVLAKSDIDTDIYTEVKATESPVKTLTLERENLVQGNLISSNSGFLQSATEYNGQSYVDLIQDEIANYVVNVDEAGTYKLLIDVKRKPDTKVLNDYIELEINNTKYVNKNSEKVTFNDYFIYPYNEQKFGKGNKEIVNTAALPTNWQQVYLTDNELNTLGITVELNKGENHITLKRISGEMLMGNLYAEKITELPTYEVYSNQHKDSSKTNKTFFVRGENFAYKNNITINPEHDSSLNVSPNSLEIDYLNVVGNGTFKKHGDKLTYLIEVPESGLYQFGLAYKTDIGKTGARKNVPVFVNIQVNEEIPFQEFENYRLPYAKDYETVVTEQYVYLEKGINTLGIEINQTNMNDVYDELKRITNEISDIALEIKKITNGITDKNRTWNMNEYLPELEGALNQYITDLRTLYDYLTTVYEGTDNEEHLAIEMSIFQLERILKNVDNLPNELNLFSEGSASVLGKLAGMMNRITVTDLTLDTLYLTDSKENVPTMATNIVEGYQKGVKELLNTFGIKKSQEETALDIWIRRPKQNYDIIQQLINEKFTPETGIEVNLSLLKADDQTKLTLANAAGNAPDLVTGLDAYYVSDIGQRGALEDLAVYPAMKELLKGLSTGAMMQVFVEESIYGISEGQDVFVAAYRTDVFDKLGLEPAETWADVEVISSVLRRNGMSAYVPLSQAGAFKPYTSTAPFIYQNGADIYSEDGMKTIFGSEAGMKAFEQMSDLFTIYGVALNVESVYQSFRDGDIAYAIMPVAEYLKLYYSAPELSGRWTLHHTPGTVQADGSIDRRTGGSGTMVAMLKTSENKEAGLAFIEWWLDPEIQKEYMNRLLTTYGDEYLFLSANPEVVETLPLPEEHKNYLIEQLGYASEVQRIPGGYVVEREISNAWNEIVLGGKDVRSSVEEASRVSDKEIQRKMKEFGYVDKDGNMIKPYQVNTREDLEEWVNSGE